MSNIFCFISVLLRKTEAWGAGIGFLRTLFYFDHAVLPLKELVVEYVSLEMKKNKILRVLRGRKLMEDKN